MRLMPRQAVPALEFDTVGGGRWSPAEAREKWGLPNLTVGYGVPIDKARDFALAKDYPARGEA
jgi:hypothetical protein